MVPFNYCIKGEGKKKKLLVLIVQETKIYLFKLSYLSKRTTTEWERGEREGYNAAKELTLTELATSIWYPKLTEQEIVAKDI